MGTRRGCKGKASHARRTAAWFKRRATRATATVNELCNSVVDDDVSGCACRLDTARCEDFVKPDHADCGLREVDVNAEDVIVNGGSKGTGCEFKDERGGGAEIVNVNVNAESERCHEEQRVGLDAQIQQLKDDDKAELLDIRMQEFVSRFRVEEDKCTGGYFTVTQHPAREKWKERRLKAQKMEQQEIEKTRQRRLKSGNAKARANAQSPP